MSPPLVFACALIALMLIGCGWLTWIDRKAGRNPFDGILAFGVILSVASLLALGGLGLLIWWLAQHVRWVP